MWYKDGQIFNSQQDIRKDNQGTSLPNFMSDVFLEELGYIVVVETENPATELQYGFKEGVEVVDGIPKTIWKVVDKTEEQLASEAKVYTDESLIEDEESKLEALANLRVTIANGKVFYADMESRLDIEQAIGIATRSGVASTSWKLAEPFEGSKIASVTLVELQEASYLALKAKSEIIGVS